MQILFLTNENTQAMELDNSQPPEQIRSTETISITLTDANDNQPMFEPSSTTITLCENPPEMTSLQLEILAIDADVQVRRLILLTHYPASLHGLCDEMRCQNYQNFGPSLSYK